MKILLTSLYFAPSIGGIETVSLLLACEFKAAGHEVIVATTSPDDSGLTFDFPVLRRPGFGALLEAARWCDVLYQNNISLPLAAPLLVVRRPWVVTHQTWIPETGGINHRSKRALLRFAHGVSISRAVAESMPVESTVIPNPYDAAIFAERPEIARTVDLVAVGRLVSDKGFDGLIDALAELAGSGLRPKLTMIGGGPELEPLRAQAAARGVADQVTFPGAMTGRALVEELNRHRIAVVPSRWKEPFGIVALEAIACGCVVVGSRDGGLADAIGPCGLTFPNNDVGALASTLDMLLRKPELLGEYRRPAPEHLRRHHPAAVAAEYLALFEKVRRT
jgi:glycosyltransferase involved in cell wall biosynthesis